MEENMMIPKSQYEKERFLVNQFFYKNKYATRQVTRDKVYDIVREKFKKRGKNHSLDKVYFDLLTSFLHFEQISDDLDEKHAKKILGFRMDVEFYGTICDELTITVQKIVKDVRDEEFPSILRNFRRVRDAFETRRDDDEQTAKWRSFISEEHWHKDNMLMEKTAQTYEIFEKIVKDEFKKRLMGLKETHISES